MQGAAFDEQVHTADGPMGAHLVLPPGGGGPGVLLLAEIFGVNAYIRQVADRLGDLGYVTLAPDFYWRTDPGLELASDPENMPEARAAANKLDRQTAAADAILALEYLRGRLPVTGGKAGLLGFCLGGGLAYEVALDSDPDAVVCYYPSGIGHALDAAERISCPVLFHFGDADPFIPREQIDRVVGLAAARDEIECHIHPGAGHAFDNPAPMSHHPLAAAAAWKLTGEFLSRTLAPSAG